MKGSQKSMYSGMIRAIIYLLCWAQVNLAWRRRCRGCSLSHKAALERSLRAEGGKEQVGPGLGLDLI